MRARLVRLHADAEPAALAVGPDATGRFDPDARPLDVARPPEHKEAGHTRPPRAPPSVRLPPAGRAAFGRALIPAADVGAHAAAERAEVGLPGSNEEGNVVASFGPVIEASAVTMAEPRPLLRVHAAAKPLDDPVAHVGAAKGKTGVPRRAVALLRGPRMAGVVLARQLIERPAPNPILMVGRLRAVLLGRLADGAPWGGPSVTGP